jgi:tRNA(Ile)-lysidine synthase
VRGRLNLAHFVSVWEPLLVTVKNSVLATESQNQLLAQLQPDTKFQIIIGLSGGVDSVVLLDLLSRWYQVTPNASDNYQLLSVHVNHGIHSLADQHESFCIEFADNYGIPIQVIKLGELPPESVRQSGLEAVARNKRYSAIQQVAFDFSALVTAHHQTDQVETVLLNILRGSGVAGAKGMLASTQLAVDDSATDKSSKLLTIARPLLDFDREMIERYALKHKLHWVEDPTNQELKYRRNFLRKSVLPLLQQHWPDYQNTISRFTSHVQEADQLLNDLAQEWLASLSDRAHPNNKVIDLVALSRLPVIRQKWIIRAWLSSHGLSNPNHSKLNEFVRQLNESQSGSAELRYIDLHGNTTVTIVAELGKVWLLVFEIDSDNDEWQEQFISLSASETLQHYPLRVGVLTVNTELLAASSSFREGQLKITALDLIGVTMRTAIHPVKRAHSQQLKKLCQENAIPVWQRQNLPVISYDGEVVWIASVGWLKVDANISRQFIVDCVTGENTAKQAIFSWLW